MPDLVLAWDKFHSRDLPSCQHVSYICRVNRISCLKENDLYDPFFLSFLRTRYPDLYSLYKLDDLIKGDWTGLPFFHAPNNPQACRKAAEKYFCPDVSFSGLQRPQQLAFSKAMDWMERHFFPHMMNSRILTHEEACKWMNGSTSPGVLWKTKYKTKADFMASEDAALHAQWEDLSTFGGGSTVWSGNMKDELRDMERVLDNKSRLFMGGSVLSAYSGIRLFAHMNSKMNASVFETWNCVGINKWTGGWNRLYRRLSKFLLGFAADISGFDSRMFAFIMWRIASFRFSCLAPELQTPENFARVFSWYLDVIQAVICLVDGVCVMKFHSNPSGSSCTANDNTLCLFVYLAYFWLMCKEHYPNYDDFMRNVIAALYGDDSTVTVSPDCPWYNLDEFTRLMGELGVIITGHSGPLQDLDFLSHDFVDGEKGFKIPCLNPDRIFCAVLCGITDIDPHKSFVRACNLRFEAYPVPLLFECLDEFCCWLISNFNISWDLSCYVMEDHIRRAYYGYESIGSKGVYESGRATESRFKITMGKKSIEQLFIEGKITRQERDARLAQRRGDKQLVSGKKKKIKSGVKTIRHMVTPVNEQDRTIGTLSQASSNKVAGYFSSLVFPKMNMCRIPDSWPRPTALVRSIEVFDVNVFLDGTANSGRFAASISPTLGAIDTVNNYKLALVQGAGVWPVDFTAPASYTSLVNGRDIRVDQFQSQLTQAPVSFNDTVSTVAGGTSPMGPGPYLTKAQSYGLPITITQPTAFTNNFVLPIGEYLVTLTSQRTASVTNNLGVLGTTTVQAIVTDDYLSTDGTLTSISVLVNVTANNQILALTIIGPGGGTNINANVTVTPIRSTLLAPNLDYGSCKQLRPVALSALATYMGPTLTNGGNIAACYVPGDTCATNFFTNNQLADQGNFTDWENLSLVPGAYNGPIRDGAYVWWSPEDMTDLEFRSPTTSLTKNYPCLIVSGQYQPGAGAGSQLCIRLEVVTIYEMVTTSQLWESDVLVGTQAHMDQVNLMLASQPHAMPNATHMEWLRRIGQGIGKGLKFVANNSKWIVPAITTLASLI
jgi:hypothetical protein